MGSHLLFAVYQKTLQSNCRIKLCQISRAYQNIQKQCLDTVRKSRASRVLLFQSSHKVCRNNKGVGVLVALAVPFTTKSTFPWITRKPSTIPSADDVDAIPDDVYILDIGAEKLPSRYMSPAFSFWDFIRISLRSLRIFLTFMPIVLFYPMRYCGKTLNKLWWAGFIFALEISGPTFVKLGQWASTRRDLFTDDFCENLGRLYRRTSPHSWYYTKLKLAKAFGKNWKDILVKFEDKKEPLGSGCVAQVYKAYIKKDMIGDEEIIIDFESDQDDSYISPEFIDGFEVLGFGKLMGHLFSKSTYELEKYPDDKTAGTGKFKKGQKVKPAETPESEVKVDGDSESQGQSLQQPCTPDDNEDLIPVAVKVLHPGIYRSTTRDIRILTGIATLIEKIFPSLKWLSLKDCVEEFADLMHRQIDLRHEARCLDQFNAHFEDVSNVRFPHPIWPFVKRSVLVETYEEGEFISTFINRSNEKGTDDENNNHNDSESDGNRPPHPTGETLQERLASIGIDTLLKMVFIDNFVHGDLHPGNIMVQNSQYYKPQENKLMMVDMCDTLVINVEQPDCPLKLVLLDVGITSSLNEKDRENFRKVFRAVVIGDGEEVADLILNHARYQECPNVVTFKQEMSDLVHKARQMTIQLGKMQVTDLLCNVFSMMLRHKIKLESNFASIILAIMVLEGLGRSLDPELDILERAKPILMGTE